MTDVFSRRNALIGWVVWKVAKRRLLRRVRSDGRRRRIGLVAAVAALVVVAVAWARRSRTP